MKTTIIIEDGGIITIPNDMIEKLEWKEGDVVEWIDNHDGSFSLVKSNDL